MKTLLVFVTAVFLLEGCCSIGELMFEPESLVEQFSAGDILNDEMHLQGDSCKCDKKSCSCCKKIEIKAGFIHIKKEVCAKLVYKQSTIGVDLQLTIDGKVIANYEIKTNNPSPLCGDIKIPGVGKEKACLKLDKFHIDNEGVAGCIKFEVAGKIKINVDVGCFKIPHALKRIRSMFLFEREVEYSKEEE